jgi:hypothetical protein
MIKTILTEEDYTKSMDEVIENLQAYADVLFEELTPEHYEFFCSTMGVRRVKARELRERLSDLIVCLDTLYPKREESFVIDTTDSPF